MRPTGVLLAALAVGIIVGGRCILPQLSSAVEMSSEGPAARYSSPRASIAASDDNVYVSWWDNGTAGNNEIFFVRSTDKGQTFGEPVNLSNSTGASADNQITAENNNVYIRSWDNKTGNWEILFARSTDNGASFADPINISNSSDLRLIGARIAAEGNYVYISWIDINPENEQRDVFVRTSSDNGQTFGELIMLTTANSTTPSSGGPENRK
ncbi:MAG TPA: sialidase family protein [Nitrososphaeraceae archaeon]|jgi:hypothetical protein|nr:sialidase family protein [Nitrososphaeraceae archaeon]